MTGTDLATYVRERPGMSAFVLEGRLSTTASAYARGLTISGRVSMADRAPMAATNSTGGTTTTNTPTGNRRAPQSADPSRLDAADRIARAHRQWFVARPQPETDIGLQEFAAIRLHDFVHRPQRVAGRGAVPVIVKAVEAALHGDLAGSNLTQPCLFPQRSGRFDGRRRDSGRQTRGDAEPEHFGADVRQWKPAAEDVPVVRRDDTTRAHRAAHFRHGDSRLRHEEEHQCHDGDIAAGIRNR